MAQAWRAGGVAVGRCVAAAAATRPGRVRGGRVACRLMTRPLAGEVCRANPNAGWTGRDGQSHIPHMDMPVEAVVLYRTVNKVSYSKTQLALQYKSLPAPWIEAVQVYCVVYSKGQGF